MNDVYDDYVQPPKYEDTQDFNNPLTTKLKLRIQQDLNQINGVYDSQIFEATDVKKKRFNTIELEYKDVVMSINNHRNHDISIYNENAEKHIDNLISNMCLIQPKEEPITWWEKIFGK